MIHSSKEPVHTSSACMLLMPMLLDCSNAVCVLPHSCFFSPGTFNPRGHKQYYAKYSSELTNQCVIESSDALQRELQKGQTQAARVTRKPGHKEYCTVLTSWPFTMLNTSSISLSAPLIGFSTRGLVCVSPSYIFIDACRQQEFHVRQALTGS